MRRLDVNPSVYGAAIKQVVDARNDQQGDRNAKLTVATEDLRVANLVA